MSQIPLLHSNFTFLEVTHTRLFPLTRLAMIAFASNSLLCRAALKQTSIDAASFTFIRIASGAATLWLILKIQRLLRVDRTASPLVEKEGASWPSALALFSYAAAFSFAYNHLSAGTGALLLFGAVQATMILWGLRRRMVTCAATRRSCSGRDRACRALVPP